MAIHGRGNAVILTRRVVVIVVIVLLHSFVDILVVFVVVIVVEIIIIMIIMFRRRRSGIFTRNNCHAHPRRVATATGSHTIHRHEYTIMMIFKATAR